MIWDVKAEVHMKLTITEALAELKTIEKRLGKKREAFAPYIWRQEGLKDPMAKEEGGSAGYVSREIQGIRDLEERIISIRTAIQTVNLATSLSIEDRTRSIAGWLTWRKEVAEGQKALVRSIQTALAQTRKNALAKGLTVLKSEQEATSSVDIIINVDEGELNREAETLEKILGDLDGKLSLLNATTYVELAD